MARCKAPLSSPAASREAKQSNENSGVNRKLI
jgi:hypothetical protein